MDVRIRVCQICHSKKVAAARLADKIKSSLGLNASEEAGYHGQLGIVVDGELIEARYRLGNPMSPDEIEAFLFTEVLKRAEARGLVTTTV